MLKSLPNRRALVPFACLALLLGCAHGTRKRVPVTPASQALSDEAYALAPITCEEDYFEAKLLYEALPEEAVERLGLRGKLLDYLLGPIAALDASELRRNPAMLGNEDDFDHLQDSFRSALDLFSPKALWEKDGLRLGERERALLQGSAKVLVAAYS